VTSIIGFNTLNVYFCQPLVYEFRAQRAWHPPSGTPITFRNMVCDGSLDHFASMALAGPGGSSETFGLVFIVAAFQSIP
jgi:hypothetical protein